MGKPNTIVLLRDHGNQMAPPLYPQTHALFNDCQRSFFLQRARTNTETHSQTLCREGEALETQSYGSIKCPPSGLSNGYRGGRKRVRVRGNGGEQGVKAYWKPKGWHTHRLTELRQHAQGPHMFVRERAIELKGEVDTAPSLPLKLSPMESHLKMKIE